ncbi:hypothetical protein VNI00_010421 [Paramarasmius palmivorus]|uniref:BTB domain-containing protein n=1 Tax=Paramarasmius palmivorus TaxID=297713 RepID=A0AAW0CJ31_9AGAR
MALSMDPAYPFPSWDADDSLLEAWTEAGAGDPALAMQFGARPMNEETNTWPEMHPYPSGYDNSQACTSLATPYSPQSSDTWPTPGPSTSFIAGLHEWQQNPQVAPQNVSVSSVFGPNGYQSQGEHGPPVDMILVSADNVVFYVDEHTLYSNSNNQFNGLLPLQAMGQENRILPLQEIVSSELQVFLQSIYNVASEDVPEVGALVRGVTWLNRYGFGPKSHIRSGTKVFEYLLSHAPLHSLEVYTCAAVFDIYALALEVSPHLLMVPPTNVSDEMAERMGGRYLLKFFLLHLRRIEALKQLLMKPPDLHSVTNTCGFEEQRILKARWNHGIAKLAFIIRAGA